MSSLRRSLSVLALSLLVAAALAPVARAQKLSEVVAHHAGAAQDHEYVELFGAPSTSYSTLRIVVLDGASNPGRIASVITPGTTNGAGFWTTGFLSATLDAPTFTLLLVSGFTGAVNDDLDANDDGALDAAPWSALLDSVALTDGTAGARTYSPAILGPDFDGLGVAPGGASRFPYWKDTDSAADWKRNDFDGEGLPGFTGTLAPGEAVNTPGWPTRVHAADYYASVDSSSSAALRTTLHAAIKDHVRYPYTASSTDTWDIINLADEDPTDSTKVWDIYYNQSYGKIPGGTGAYNREHSWPNSLGFPVDTMLPYTDVHHLFASEVTWNADRGNKPYGSCPSGCTEHVTVANHGVGGGSGVYPGNSNWYSGAVWETWIGRRGDVARAQLYLDVRYEGEYHAVTNAFEPNLVLTDDVALIVGKTASPADPKAYMGLLSAILQWHQQDPPDAVERRRNDVVASFQGNRNPFIDHPEWAACVFQGTGCAPRLADAATIDRAAGATGATRHLNASPRSADSFSWQVTARPAASVAALSNANLANPTFVPDQPGDYTFQLTATKGALTNVTTIALTASGATCAATAAIASFTEDTCADGPPVAVRADVTGTAPFHLVWSDGLVQDDPAAGGSVTRTVPAGLAAVYTISSFSDAVCAAAATGSATIVPHARTATPVISASVSLVAGSPNHLAFVADHPGSVYAWTVANGTITAGQGTARITFTAGSAGSLDLSVTESDAGACTPSSPGSATVPVLASASPTLFSPLAPCRVLDTREPEGPLGGPAIAAGADRIFTMAGACGVPSDARALSVNVTVVAPPSAGSLKLHAADEATGTATALSFSPGKVRANNAVLSLANDGSGKAGIRNESAGPAHVVVDVNGFFR